MMTLALWALVLTSPAQHRPQPDPSLAPSPGPALSVEQASERVHTYLNSIDTPIPEASWVALGPNAAPALEAVLDRARFSFQRSRAITALALVSPQRAALRSLALAKDGHEAYIVRAAAMRAAARVVPPAQLQAELAPVLQKDPDVQVRASAASALARHAPGCATLKAQLVREKPENHGYFQDALGRCAAP